MKALKPRPYQRDALAARAAHPGQRVAIVLPTGAGKTVCFAHQCLEPGRTLVLVHTTELASQALAKVKDVAPGLDAEIFMGVRKAIGADVVVGGVQTVVRHLDSLGRFDRIIVDECHHAAATTYLKILKYFGAFEPDGPLVTGYTATLGRSDEKSLGKVWEDVAFTRSISWMIRREYLVNVRGVGIVVPDLALATRRGKDYRDDELGEAMADSLAPEVVARAFKQHARIKTNMCKACQEAAMSDLWKEEAKPFWPTACPAGCAGTVKPEYRRGLGFAPTVYTAGLFAKAFEREGITSDVVHGGMTSEDRDLVLKRHRAGDFQVLWNCMVLTEGYDDPKVSCVILARPTHSKTLFQQMAGRGLRVDPDLPWAGQDCLLLEVSGMGGAHDLCSIVDLSEKAVKDDGTSKTLTELEDEFDHGEGVAEDLPVYYKGEVESFEFNPLGQPSTKVWLKTAGGTYFVPAGKLAYVFIMEYPEPGRWSVAWAGRGKGDWFTEDADGVPRWGAGRPVGMTGHRGLPLDQALVWAEDLALDMGADLNKSNKAAPWRKKKPSEKFARFATTLGLKPGPDERQGALSDRVDVLLGSRRLDPIVTSVKGKR